MSAGLYIANMHERKHPLKGNVVRTSKQDGVAVAGERHSQGDFWSWEHLNQDLGKKEVTVQRLQTVYFRQREDLGNYPNQGTNLAGG